MANLKKDVVADDDNDTSFSDDDQARCSGGDVVEVM